jgi:hypothetical protein
MSAVASSIDVNASVPSEPALQAASFFETLAHDDRNSTYILARRDRGGRWSETPFTVSEGLPDMSDRDSDWYVTHNGFRGSHRRAGEARQINAIFFDVDCHSGDFASVVPLLVGRLEDAFAADALPRPTMVVSTGRGVHLYYVLRRSTPTGRRGGRSNDRGISFVGDVTRRLSLVLRSVVGGIDGAEVDDAVYDFARVGRVPGTFNTRSRTMCRLIQNSGRLWELQELGRYRVSEASGGTAAADSARQSSSRRGRRSRGAFEPVLASRLRGLQELMSLRRGRCEGHRDNMDFVYYNTATQIYGPEKASHLLEAFNRQFEHPLPQADLDQIRRTIDSVTIRFGAHAGEHGYYPLSRENVIGRLGISEEEIALTGFLMSSKQRARAESKRSTSRRRALRDDEICRLYSQCGLTQAAIAKRIGCSLRTVSSVTSRRGAKRGKTWGLREAVASAVANKREASSVAAMAEGQRDGSKVCAKNWSTSYCGVAPVSGVFITPSVPRDYGTPPALTDGIGHWDSPGADRRYWPLGLPRR